MQRHLPGSFRIAIHSYQRPWMAPVLLALVCFFVYNVNLRQIGSGDTVPARYLPLILWHSHTLEFDNDARWVAHGHSLIADQNRPAGASENVTYFEPSAYWMVRTRDHHLASMYPVLTPVLVSPLYLPAVLWLNANGWNQPNIDRVAELMEKISASFLASLATVLMFLVLRRDSVKWALPLALAFAFGTNTWMISSQALWQHGTGELLVALALLLIVSDASPLRIALLGAVCGLMVANRPPDGLVASAIVLFSIWKSRRDSLWLLVGAAIPLAALMYYNLDVIGHYAGGYALRKSLQKPFFELSWSGLPGLFISPARGLLVFSPFLIFVPVGLIQRFRSPSKGIALALSCAVAAQCLLYSQADWRAGVSWGPRWLTDILPILIWMLAPAPLVLRPRAGTLLITAMTASVMVQVIGAFWYTKVSDARIFAGNPASMSGAWNPRNVPFLVELRHPWPTSELLCDAVGEIDRVGSTPTAGSTLPALEHGASLEGWALTCGRTPAQLLLLIDGIVIGSTTKFFPRADINEVTHTSAPSGWSLIANTSGITSGERVLQLAVRTKSESDIRIVRELHVLVIPKEPFTETAKLPQKSASAVELDAMAQRAASLLRERQSQYGFWLTAYTKSLRYEGQRQEMNTFLTSMLVDVLSPVVHERGAEDLLARARQHLAAQIESNGLVRYHGLVDGPTIGKLGYPITPDADDTALAWRIAQLGPQDPREQSMLKWLTSYRDARGLYRTWLAPVKQYQNLDPGRDPNPTDIAIQMHVYLMLRELDPPTAQNLCTALQKSWDGDLWIYYAKAPIVPYFRSAELRKLGCSVQLPTERLSLPAAGQEIWNEAIFRLVQGTSSAAELNVRQSILNLLTRIGTDDFAELRKTPPLLFHNDLTAPTKRFYWSEDFGYALWLRLYEVTRQPTP